MISQKTMFYCHECGNEWSLNRETPPACGCCGSPMSRDPWPGYDEEQDDECVNACNGIADPSSIKGLLTEALEALRCLYDYQNGCPLPKYEKSWSIAMHNTKAILSQRKDEQAK